MARYEHLPIYRDAYDLALHLENLVRHFSRYHKYTLGTDLRNAGRRVLETVIEANSSTDRGGRLLELRQQLERFKVLARLCHDAGGFASRGSYLHVAERITNLARQNEGWLKNTRQRGGRRE